MTLAQIHDADLAKILTDAGNTFTWNGTDYACIATDRARAAALEPGGFLEDYDLTLQTRVSLFGGGTLPVANQKVTHNSVEYRIERVRVNFTAQILTLNLMSTAK